MVLTLLLKVLVMYVKRPRNSAHARDIEVTFKHLLSSFIMKALLLCLKMCYVYIFFTSVNSAAADCHRSVTENIYMKILVH